MNRAYILLLFLFANNVFADEFISYEEVTWLPDAFKIVLGKDNCLIPKNVIWDKVSIKLPVRGVIVGQFAKQGQYDIAVFCTNGGQDHIYIYWGGESPCPSVIQSWGETISIVGEDFIQDSFKAYGGVKPPKIKHDAINIAILGKSSTVYYCYEGKWLELTGAD